ncbi:MAG: YhbY family RNA-binding protein [Myxococcota bacterium]|jgi:RNA-binding protein|nr:YhbY family RNA-binding protein [Myxococcota bacterium]
MPPESPALTGQQRKWLRGQAHALKPIVHIGEAGLSASVIEATRAALDRHELIKVRLQQPTDKRGTAQQISEQASATLCGLVGHTVILYRAHPENPKLVLPGE